MKDYEIYSSLKVPKNSKIIIRLDGRSFHSLARDLKLAGIRTAPYTESMNKHIKIVTYLKAIWVDVVFVEGTDKEYIEQITDYNENAEHDDAPDSAACLARLMYRKTKKKGGGNAQ